MKIVKATFKGKDGSMTFRTGKEYVLHMGKYGDGGLVVHADEGMGWCIYGSFIAFLNNWNLIESI